MSLRCWFGMHNFVVDDPNWARRFCSRCNAKSLLTIDKLTGKAQWQDIIFPDEGFWGLPTRFRQWRAKL
jgi:hypothetical protein